MKKFIFCFTFFLACSFQIYAQWAGSTTTSGDINRSGKVGIGTTTPTKLLDVEGDVKIGSLNNRHYLKITSKRLPEIRFQTPTSDEQMRLGVAHDNSMGHGVEEGDFYVNAGASNTIPLIVKKNGNISLVYNNVTKKVGIGTINPQQKLHVSGGELRVEANNGYIDMKANLSDWARIYTNRPKMLFNKDVYTTTNGFSSYSGDLQLKTQGNEKMRIKTNGNVGIGTNNPQEKLHINGNELITGVNPTLCLENSSTNHWTGGQIVFKNLNTASGGSFSVEHERKATGAGNGNSVFFIRQYMGNGDRINSMLIDGDSNDIIFNQDKSGNPTYGNVIFRNGNVQIGDIPTPNGYKLAVDGKVICEELKVELSQNWPDYVFEHDYDLKPLAEVEAHIQAKGHLPNTPSAKEIEAENGFEVGTMTVNQQEKIEEIFLHLIEMKKEIEKLKKENVELKKQITSNKK